MSILTNRNAAIQTNTGINSQLRAWANEATSRIETNSRATVNLTNQLTALTTRVTSLEGRVAALEAKVNPSPPPVPVPVPPPAPAPAPGPAAPVGPFTEMDGHNLESSAIFDHSPAGKTYEKLHVQNYLRQGIGVMVWPAMDIATPVTIRDSILENVASIPPRSANGTAEACLWVGNKALVNRVKIRNGAWMGMWTGAACFDSVFEDIEVYDCPHVGLYIEHETKRCVFRRCSFTAQDNAVNVEWWYGGKGSNSLVFEDCEFHSVNGWGIFADAGTYDLTVRRCKFSGLNGIALPRNLAGPTPNNFDAQTCDLSGVTGTKTLIHNNAIGA